MKILNRNEFVNEVYTPMMEEKEYKELQEINEGLLKNLFGAIRNHFSSDWNRIKGDKSIKDAYKEIDNSLSGFSTMKFSKREQCNQIRQELVDFASDWYDYKMNKAKENDEDPKMAISMEFKDETLADNLESTKKKIKEIANGDKLMMKWADLLLDDMKTVINRVVMNDIEDEEVKKKMEEEEKKSQEKKDKINKAMESFQKKTLQDMEKQRNQQLEDLKVQSVNISLSGDKAVQELCKGFNEFSSKIIKESLDTEGEQLNEIFGIKSKKEKKEIKVNYSEVVKMFEKDNWLGLNKIFIPDFDNYKELMNEKSPKDDTKKGIDNFEKNLIITYELMKLFYDNLSDKKTIEKFKDVPAQSVQAMCIGVNSFLKHSVYEKNEPSDEEIALMTSCAIVSNGLISYNLPMAADGKNNYFTEILTNFSTMDSNKDLELPEYYKKQADSIFNDIVSKAKEEKEIADKKYEVETNKVLKRLKLDK